MFPFINRNIEKLSKRQIGVFVVLCLIFIVIHYTIVLFALLPTQYVPHSARILSKDYVSPSFEQIYHSRSSNAGPWKFDLEARIHDKGWQSWQKPNQFFVKGEKKLLTNVSNNIAVDLHEASISDNNGIYFVDDVRYLEKLERSFAYFQAMLYVDRYFTNAGHDSYDSIQLRLNYHPLDHNLWSNPPEPTALILKPTYKND